MPLWETPLMSVSYRKLFSRVHPTPSYRDNSYQLGSSCDHSRKFPLVKDDCISYISPRLMRFKCKLSECQDTQWIVIDELYPLVPNTWLDNLFKIKTNPKQNFQVKFGREAETPLSSYYLGQKKRRISSFTLKMSI